MSATYPTILCVDDARYLLDLRKLQLEKAGYRILTAETGEEPLRVFAEHVDLLLTDYSLPDINGIALGRMLKRSRPDLAVVLISGWPDCSLETKDIDLILPKPMDAIELMRAIARLLPPAERYGT